MTDFDRTSNSKTANILSASRDWLSVIVQTHSYENLKPRTGLINGYLEARKPAPTQPVCPRRPNGAQQERSQ
jgi:hypothetical protein